MKAIIENIVFKYQKEVICVGIFLINRNEWRISVVRVKIRNGEINIVSALENLKELKEAESILQPEIPVILHIDGWGVLIKENGTGNNSIPVDNHEFFLKQYPKPDGSGAYFSIIRNDLLKSIVDTCLSESLHIIGLAFGPFNIGLLAPFLEKGKEINAGKWKLTLNKGLIDSLLTEDTETNSTYEIGGEKITSGLLPLYATTVSFFSGGEDENNNVTAKSRQEFIYGRLVKYLILSSLSVMLLLLLLNYFIWDSLRNRNTRLMFEVANNEQLLTQLTGKEKELKEKKNLVVKYIGTNEKTHYSWYADKLALSLPAGIQLTLMDIQPISKKPKPGIPIFYKNRQIEVEGDAKSMAEISEYVKAIGKENWAKQVELISFSTENDHSSGHFKLQINY